MQKVTVIIEKGNIGSDYMMLAISGIEIPTRPIPIISSNTGVGWAKPFVEDDMLKAELLLGDGDYSQMHPCIGYTSLESEGGIVKRSKLIMLELSANKNHDKTILSIKDQIKTQ